MASSRDSSYASSQETTNFARICRIVVDVLRDILWQVLIYEIPAGDLPNTVRNNQNILGNLDKDIKTWLCGISPTSPEIPIAEKFDVTSLYTLIRNLCIQVPTPSIQWGKTPPPGGTTLGDDIERVRGFRNTLYGHAKQAEINSADFNTLCIDITNVVCRFDAHFSSKCRAMKCDFKNGIDTILTCSMDKNLQNTYIDKMAEIGILSDDLENVKQQVEVVKQQVGSVEQQVDEVKQQVKHEVDDVKQQVADLKKDDLENVKQQVEVVKQQVGSVEQQVDEVKQQVKQEVDDVKQQVADLKKEMKEIRETSKKNPDVMEKEYPFRQDDLQTTAVMLATEGSNQPINLNKIPQQLCEVEEQTSADKTEVSPVLEDYSAPEDNIQVIPEEIMRMDEESIQIFKKALSDRKEKVHNIRVMVVGRFKVGKTTLTKQLLGDDVNLSKRESTEGIDVHIHRCRVSRATGKWLKQDKDAEEAEKVKRYFKLLNDEGQEFDISSMQAENSTVVHQMVALDEKEKDVQQIASKRSEKGQNTLESSSMPSDVSYQDEDEKDLKASRQEKEEDNLSGISKEALLQTLEQSAMNAGKSNSKEMVKNMLQYLTEHADKLVKIREEYWPLSMWDFAGQYVYYTTHQTFLTHRAIYLLVIDLNQNITDPVEDDECFFDIEGKKECEVHDLVELWMNSIHSCEPSLQSGIPPVILVGTHADLIPKDVRQERCEDVFRQIRSHYLKGRPALFHLADEDFSIDNTFVDPKLKDLQKKIVELASKQPYWGECVPGRWLPLEEQLFSLKANGVKVIPYRFLEMMNQEGAIRIESKEELDLFLKFQHDIGNILHFSTKELRDWIVLEPQWLIKAMKSLITADMFILTKHPRAAKQWSQFKEEGKLTQELLDIIWSKENEPDLYEHKPLILLLLEQLNIVARPRMFTENGDKAENFFLAPCMLRQTTPREVISPKVKSSSVLCFVFMGKFLPSPIFHRLVAVCVAKWPIHKKRGSNQIFCGCCVFQINRLYRLTLYFKSYVIFARITLAGAEHQTLDAAVCIPVREFINYHLSKILGNLNQNLKFELFIQCQCPVSVGDCLESMFHVKELNSIAELTCCYHDDHMVASNSLLKYWFQNELEINFLAPCMLKEAATDDVFPKPLAEMMSSSVLCYVFVEQSMPSLIFHHLITKCMARWPIAKKMSENLIFSDSCVVDLDNLHTLTVFIKKNVIFVRVTIAEKIPSFTLSIEANEFITMTLSKVIEYLGESREFQMSIQCLRSDGYSVNCLIPIADLQNNEALFCHCHHEIVPSYDLLKFWFRHKRRKDPLEQTNFQASDQTEPEIYHLPLPPGKKYHVFFSYAYEDIQWVKETVKKLENDHGFVCREYDRDNLPGSPLLRFAEQSIKYACKTVVVMTDTAFKSDFVQHEIQMALLQGFNERTKCIVPVLLKDCTVPGYLCILNYVDVRDPSQRDIWWPKLLLELRV